MVQVTREFVHHCLPVRKRDGHKGTFGKVHILAGSVGLTGAAARSALAGGVAHRRRRSSHRLWSGISVGSSRDLARVGGEMPGGYAGSCGAI